MVFALELKLSKTLRGLVYFVLQLQGVLRPPLRNKYGTKCTSPLRVSDNFNSKAKAIATFGVCKIQNAKLKVARFLPNESALGSMGPRKIKDVPP